MTENLEMRKELAICNSSYSSGSGISNYSTLASYKYCRSNLRALKLNNLNPNNRTNSSISVLNKKRPIILFHQNIENLISRIESLEIILNEINPRILVITEHNVKENELDYLKVDRYNISAYYCRKSAVKGGVMILSGEGLSGKPVVVPVANNLCEDKIFEFCAVKYKLENVQFIVVGLYRSPSSDPFIFLNRLNLLITLLLKRTKFIILAGDININVLVSSKEHSELKNILRAHGLNYLIKFPTRVCSTTSTCIDNFMTNFPIDQTKVEGIISNLSDHDAQILEINTNTPFRNDNSYITWHKRNFTENNKKRFLDMLSMEDWFIVYNAPVEIKFDVFLDSFLYYFNYCFPKNKCRRFSGNKKRWITSDLYVMQHNLRNLSEFSRVSPDPILKKAVRDKKKEYVRKVIETKSKFYEKMLKDSSNVCKTTWRIIGEEINNKKERKHNNIILNFDGCEVHDPVRISNVFNDHYVGLAESKILPNLKTKSNLSSSYFSHYTDKLFIPKSIEPHEMDKVIMSFENKFSTGYDDIPITVIKLAKNHLVRPLSHLINSSFISGIFPDKLKISKVKPLYKSDDRKNVSNYRPLSLLPIFSKIYERVMANQLTEFLENNKILDDEQHGFRAGKSVITASIDFIESVINSMDQGDKSIGVLMDLSKAFDSVSHIKLLSILKKLGIKNRSLLWFKSYFENRKQFVEICALNSFNQLINHSSKLKDIKYGVPQGSILGPLLFICYLKGLPTITKSDNITLYADDINVRISRKTVQEVEITAFNLLACLEQKLSDRCLLLNPSKTKVISFITPQTRVELDFNIFLDEYLLEEVNEVRFLGLILDKNFNWNSHVSAITKKLASGLFVLNRVSKFSSLQTMKTLYFAFIQSHITFGIVLYGSTSNDNLNKLLVFQKKSIRSILKLDWNHSVKHLFAELGIMTVYSLYIFELILYIKRNKDKIETLGHNHDYNTRSNQDYAFSRHNLKLFEKKPSYAGIRFYNALSLDLKSIQDFNSFKSKVKSLLLSKPLYSLNEFFNE